jgi:putative transposase
VKRYDIPGHAHFLTFSCYRRARLLAEERRLVWLCESVRAACDGCGIALWAYVFMPDHVHLLIKPKTDCYRIADFLKAAKQPAAMRILNSLKQSRSPVLEELALPDTGPPFRHRVRQAGGGYDYNIWSMSKAMEKARYCHLNPVAQGLVEDPSDWRWSSYRWIQKGETNDAPLRIDSWNCDNWR